MKKINIFIFLSLCFALSARLTAMSHGMPDKYVLENKHAYYQFGIDGSKLYLVSMKDKIRQVEFIESKLLPAALNNIWQITLRNEAGREIVLNQGENFKSNLKQTAKGQQLDFSWQVKSADAGNLDVEASAILENDSPFVDMRINVNNSGSEYGVWTVQFPVINNIRKLSDNGQDCAAIPGGNGGGAGEGQILKDPFKTLIPHTRTYPCYWQSMQFNAYYADGGGLYFATYDGDGYLKAFILNPLNSDVPSLHYEINHYPESCGKAGLGFKQAYPALIGPFAGDWYDACRIYRSWALKQKWCAKGPLEKRDDISPSIKNGSYWIMFAAEFEPLAPGETYMRKLARTLPVEEVQKRARSWDIEKSLAKVKELNDYFGYPMILWCNSWWEGGGDISAPRYIPMKNVKEFTQQLHQRFPNIKLSGHMAPKRFSTQLLEFNQDVNETLERRMDGTIYSEVMHEDKDDIYVFPAWTTDWWQNFWKNKAYNIVSQTGLDGFHVDEFASYTSFSAQDFDRTHPRWGGGTVYGDTRRNIYTIIRSNARRANPEFAAHHEALCELYIDVADLAEVCTTPANTNAPLWEAVYHDYNFTMGRRITKWHDENTWPSGKEPGDANIGEFIAAFSQTYIWGNQPGWTRTDVVSFSPKAAAYIKKLMDARYRAMKFLNTGDMMRPLTVTNSLPDVRTIWRLCDTPEHILPAVLNSVWKASDGTVGIVMVNISDKPQEISYKYNISECGLKGEKFMLTRIDTSNKEKPESINGSALERTDTIEAESVKIIEISAE